MEEMAAPPQNDLLTEKIIGFAIEVHRHLGPGLLESAYEECLCYELTQSGHAFQRQVPLPVVYKGVHLDCGYDSTRSRSRSTELKTVERLMPIHDAQLLTYMKLSGMPTGLLELQHSILKDGLRRLMLQMPLQTHCLTVSL
jgi:GxxExxY protein